MLLKVAKVKMTMLWLLVCPSIILGSALWTLEPGPVHLSVMPYMGVSFKFRANNYNAQLLMEIYQGKTMIDKKRCNVDTANEWQTVDVITKQQQWPAGDRRRLHQCSFLQVPETVTHIMLYQDGPGFITVQKEDTSVQPNVDHVWSVRLWSQVVLVAVMLLCLCLSCFSTCLIYILLKTQSKELSTEVDVEDSEMITDELKTDDKEKLISI